MKVYVIGDSISIHYGPFLQQALAGVMDYARKEGDDEARLNLDVPMGANGGDSDRVLAFVKAAAGAGGFHADILAVNCGLHDIKRDPATRALQVPLDRYEANLRELVRVAATMPLRLVWIRTTPCDESIHNARNAAFHRFAADCGAYNAAADRIMAEAGVPMADLFTFTANLGPDLFCDHVHFTVPVRERQAAFLAGWLGAFAAVVGTGPVASGLPPPAGTQS